MNGKNSTLTPQSKTQLPETTTAELSAESADSIAWPWLKIARLAWYPTAALSAAILIAAIPGLIIIGTDGVVDPRFSPNPSPTINIITWFALVIAIIVSFGSLFLSFLLYRRRANDRMALLISFFLLGYGVIITGPLEALEPFVPGIAIFTTSYLITLFQPLILLLFALFPDGRFVPRWTRWVVLTAFLVSPLSLFWTTRYGDPSIDYSSAGIILVAGLTLLVAVGIWASTIYAQIYRYRRVSNAQQKQQTKWILYGLGLMITAQAIISAPWIHSYSLPPGTPYPIWLAATTPIWLVSIAIVPLFLTIAVMRFRLFEIDIIINRSLLFGTLTLIVILIYILVVGTLGTFFQAQGNLLIALLATGIVAVLFHPLRERMQRGVNRLVYGERDDPVEALSRLGKQLELAVPPDDVQPRLVETIAKTLKLPYVGILLTAETGETTAAEYGDPTQDLFQFPLTYQGEHIGRLVVVPRSPGSSFSLAEMRLLRNIARQAGAAVHAIQLTIDLQRSRQRLVTAREEERRRLRRDLHDGLGSTLAALHIQTNAVNRLIRTDPDTAELLVAEFKSEIREAIADIRRVVYELRPPTLDEMGLVGAIQTYASQCSREVRQQTAADERPLTITVNAPDDLPPLSAATEVAAYHIVREALTNVLTHAQASCCLVCLTAREHLEVTIEDDGIGFHTRNRNGVGLMSMRERAEELSGTFTIQSLPVGGTQVMACLPFLEE